jgi:hypothetical protein
VEEIRIVNSKSFPQISEHQRTILLHLQINSIKILSGTGSLNDVMTKTFVSVNGQFFGYGSAFDLLLDPDPDPDDIKSIEIEGKNLPKKQIIHNKKIPVIYCLHA